MLGSARRPKKARRNSGERSAGSSTYPITVHRRTLEAEVPEKERKGRVGTVDFPCGESILLLLLLLRFCHLSAGDCTRCCCNSSKPFLKVRHFLLHRLPSPSCTHVLCPPPPNPNAFFNNLALFLSSSLCGSRQTGRTKRLLSYLCHEESVVM